MLRNWFAESFSKSVQSSMGKPFRQAGNQETFIKMIINSEELITNLSGSVTGD